MQALLSILNKDMTNTSFKFIKKLFNFYVFNIMKTVTAFIYIHILDGKWLKKKRKNSMPKEKKKN